MPLSLNNSFSPPFNSDQSDTFVIFIFSTSAILIISQVLLQTDFTNLEQ